MTAITRDLFDEVMCPNYNPAAVLPVRGEGSRLWDQQGREYIDFAGGIAVNALGHAHPELVAALEEQGRKLWHLSNVYTNEPALQLAADLVAATFADKVYFANSGAEANEAALKLARRWAVEHHGEDKAEIISCEKSFHGRTFFTVTVGGQPAYSEGFGPKPGAVSHVPFNDLDALAAKISARTCAVMLEPLQGEGGVKPAAPGYLEGVRKLCDEHDALLILDEVQSGVGRTGMLYAHEHAGIDPDILTTAKALGGGFPIGAMLTTDRIAPSLKVGTHGSTYGGNPLACAVAGRVLSIIKQPEFLAGVREREGWFREGLEAINARYEVFAEIRGQGLLLGAQLAPRLAGRARELLNAGVEQGVMTLVAGPDVLRFAPALNISQDEARQGLERLERAVAAWVAAADAA